MSPGFFGVVLTTIGVAGNLGRSVQERVTQRNVVAAEGATPAIAQAKGLRGL